MLFLSFSKPLTSLIISTPATLPTSIVPEFLVSREIGILRCLKAWIVGKTLRTSLCSDTLLAPGLVDSPPISIKSAPFSNILFAFSMDFLLSTKSPPSEKLSGVRFRIPNIINFLLLNILFFEVPKGLFNFSNKNSISLFFFNIL